MSSGPLYTKFLNLHLACRFDYSTIARELCRSKPQIPPRSRAMSTGGHKETCLTSFHKSRNARMEPFAGYLMPIVYKDQSIKNEHMQTRKAASAFDVSHMMQTKIKGKDRVRFVESLTVADIENMGLDRCTLSVFTNEKGGIIDDCIISRRKDHIHIVSNAGNADVVWSWLVERRPIDLDVELERISSKGLIALQGPKAAAVLQELVKINLSDIEFMNTFDADINSIGVSQITRCGYTGEDGFEISVDASKAEHLMNMLCQKSEVRPAGLGARDTLRLEAGLCLHGHDISAETTPVEAALNWTIHKRRRTEGGFIGSNIVLDQLKTGSKIKRVGLAAVRGGPPAREGSIVKDLDSGQNIGSITSGTYAPKCEKNIAMAYVPTELSVKPGKIIGCEIRGKIYEYEVTRMPFVKSNYYFKNK